MSGTTAATAFLLPNDWILDVPIDAATAAGVMVPLPAGDVPSVVSDTPASLNVAIGTTPAGLPSFLVNALVDGSVDPTKVYTVTLTDSAGLGASTTFWQIVPDNTPTTLLADIPGASHTTQAVPAVG